MSIPVCYNKLLIISYLLLDQVFICVVPFGLNCESKQVWGRPAESEKFICVYASVFFFLLFLLLEIDFIYQITRT